MSRNPDRTSNASRPTAFGTAARPRRVLVTGGAGFIGSHLVSALQDQGDEPIVLDDFSTGDMSNVLPGVDVVEADIADPGVVEQIVDLRPMVVIHAAAQASVPRSMKDPARDRAVNLLGTAHIIDGVRAIDSCRLVYLSTGGGIYGETDGAANENSLPRPKAFYSIHKYAAEKYVEISNVSYAIARLANVYGPRQRSDLEGGVVAIFARQMALGEPVTVHGSGDQHRDFIHVSDVVSAILRMLDSPLNRIWNVGTGVPTTVNELLAAMQSTLGIAADIRWEPQRQADVFSSCLSIDRIQVDLSWRPQVSLAEGINSLRSPQCA